MADQLSKMSATIIGSNQSSDDASYCAVTKNSMTFCVTYWHCNFGLVRMHVTPYSTRDDQKLSRLSS